MGEIEVIAGHLSSLRPRRRPDDPQTRFHGFDLPTLVASLFPGGERDFELGSQFLVLEHVYQVYPHQVSIIEGQTISAR